MWKTGVVLWWKCPGKFEYKILKNNTHTMISFMKMKHLWDKKKEDSAISKAVEYA
jgi:hypothetical protein